MNRRRLIWRIKRFILTLAILILVLFLIRLINSRELDDLSPNISCSEEIIEKSKILWIIPKLENKSIAEEPEWCKKILNLNKTLGMHGVYHEFEEFNTNRNQAYLQEGIEIFEKCFGYKPEKFKPPQLKISEDNKKLVKNNNLKLKKQINQATHKVYHCNDSGPFPNKLIDFF